MGLRMTEKQLDEISSLYATMGKSWEVADEKAMLEAISDEAAASLINELTAKLHEKEWDSKRTKLTTSRENA